MENIRYDEETINSLIENRERETLYVDYKSVKALEKTHGSDLSFDISKDVSAFANAAGGSILYGINEKDHVPVDVDGTIEIEEKKEWLNRVINGNTMPRIEGIEIYPVRFETRPGKAILVVSIPMSHTAHQAKDKRYYHRYDEESLPMDDYQVRQTMYRGVEPNLVLRVRRDEIVELPIIPSHKQRYLEFYTTNLGRVTAKSCWFNLYLPNVLEIRHQGHWDDMTGRTPERKGLTHYQLRFARVNPTYGTENITIHPGQEYILSGVNNSSCVVLVIPDSYSRISETFYGYYEFWAENMPPRYGRIGFIFTDEKSIIEVDSIQSLPNTNSISPVTH